VPLICTAISPSIGCAPADRNLIFLSILGAPPCPSGETAVKITGLDGSVCAPACSTSQPCPAAGAGVTAKPECVIEQPGSSSPSLCALICVPATGFLGSGGCPSGATCEAIQV
jgi:hypothetical protein